MMDSSPTCPRLEQPFFEIRVGQELASGLGDQDLLLELDALASSGRAGIAFYAENHAGLYNAVVPILRQTILVEQQRELVAQSDAMGDRRKLVAVERLGKPPGELRDFDEAAARFEYFRIANDLLIGQRVEPFLLAVRRPASCAICRRNSRAGR
jgi:hypothetical protein